MYILLTSNSAGITAIIRVPFTLKLSSSDDFSYNAVYVKLHIPTQYYP